MTGSFSLAIILSSLILALGAVVVMMIKRQQGGSITALFGNMEKILERMERGFKEDHSHHRQEVATQFKQSREELSTSLKQFSELFTKQLHQLTQQTEQRLEKMRDTVEKKLTALQDDNSKKLEKMRLTVDEKLHATLEKRLGSSFKLVSERLEQVHKGLGEMKTLATGVGDLKKVLTNVKTRGTWGEIQLGNLLEQILTPDQYETNVATKPRSQERVEFAIKLPGQDKEGGEPVWLPIDAKFPQEDYERLIQAQEESNLEQAELAAKQLEKRFKTEARHIRDKYLSPPRTTDFGILFVPIESLYAELMRRPGLYNTLQRDCRVIVAGPTTLTALLNSLQMGFRTLAIEKRSSEVWTLLSSVKSEFGKFGAILEKTQKKIREAGNTIDLATQKTRNIERKLGKVQGLPEAETPEELPLPEAETPEELPLLQV